MGAQRVVRGELRRDLLGKGALQPAAHVDRGELLVLALGILLQLLALLGERRGFQVLLGMHRDVFACRHGHRARHHARGAGKEHAAFVPVRGGHAQDLQDLWHVEVPFSLRSRKGACWSVLA